ncbi:hypothetical protein HJFPF1_13287 [Paramyrothecium foliicola]|nr:hypothetical protein HJFPF1_13287 [Paramyrothecium foliicola]
MPNFMLIWFGTNLQSTPAPSSPPSEPIRQTSGHKSKSSWAWQLDPLVSAHRKRAWPEFGWNQSDLAAQKSSDASPQHNMTVAQVPSCRVPKEPRSHSHVLAPSTPQDKMVDQPLPPSKVAIRLATADEIPAIVRFTKAARISMFPMLSAESHGMLEERELSGGFQKTYLDDPEGAFLGAWIDGQLVATIAFVAYDSRFPYLNLGSGRVVEVIRLYVEPAFRRVGLASQLLNALKNEAQARGIELLYLHTHPFLPGAITFWQRHGFSILHVDYDPVWQTTHMSLPMSE